MGSSTIINVPTDLSDLEALRRCLEVIVEQIDIIQGYRSSTKPIPTPTSTTSITSQNAEDAIPLTDRVEDLEDRVYKLENP